MTLRDDTRALLVEMLARYPALQPLEDTALGAVSAIVTCHRVGGKILLCGNGGSAADCDHIAGELVKGFRLPRCISADEAAKLAESGDARLSSVLQCGIAAFALTSHGALASAIINDNGGEWLYAQQVWALGRAGDVLWTISTSGNSPNILAALRVARARGITTLGLTGAGGGKMAPLCDILLDVPETETFKVQELHLPLYHAVCAVVEYELFGEGCAAI